MSIPRFIGGNNITLLHNGVEYFPMLEAAIDAARYEIHLEVYIFEYDATGTRISDALKRAAQRGVSVHLLLDGFGSQNLPKKIIRGMLNVGIKILIFREESLFSKLRRYRLRRMHRKLVVLDAQRAFVGGINIIDDLHNPKKLTPRFDYAILIEGPLLITIHAAARRLWLLVAWAHFRKRWTNHIALQPTDKPCGNQLAALVIRDNLRHRRDIEGAYLHAIIHSYSEIIIANAYFLPGRNFRLALSRAAQRGVKVILLLQGRAEYRLQYHATRALYRNLLDAGIEIYEYNKSYLHAKVAVIDQHWATVGSSNIDPFSLLLAREANVVISDQSFAATLRLSLKQAIAEESIPVLRSNWDGQSCYNHTINWISYYIVRMMQGLLGYNWEDSNS
ncbi:cardiolipin synthase [Nitrosomonas cryotolerans]|uniref:Cardiolipin synthase B n=1 Tax=Nitrosomonas cryotolerans ATCC 49181 TaxID=1131553 RepID=A0A1N6IH56_9PROT|nr:cardiolipin synthase ClsB [Nitrosomonas cryotolerans]SFP96484.1 cardiolipin synthase [Nitrosomonas cryotolerans]SIO31364.1 putative cardiolipin synthase [Nitrosomonas cryotolerans ATCC 49181]